MDFCFAIRMLRRFKAVRRKSKNIIIHLGVTTDECGDPFYEIYEQVDGIKNYYTFTTDDIMAQDWEVV